MYPINVPELMRRGTLGSNAHDRTLRHRPSRRLGPQRALAAIRHDTLDESLRASGTQKPVSAGGC